MSESKDTEEVRYAYSFCILWDYCTDVQGKWHKHHKPHIHAEYAGNDIVIVLDDEILEGTIPKNKLKLLEAWMELRREDLEANWTLLSQGDQFFRVDPLK